MSAPGVPWLALSAGRTAVQALEAGFHPFILGEIVKAASAAGVLGLAWTLLRP
jgi:biotin transport system substrate-specific component